MNLTFTSGGYSLTLLDITVSYLNWKVTERYNQYPTRLSTGNFSSKEIVPFEVREISLLFPAVSQNKSLSLQTFFKNVLHWKEEKFTLTVSGNCFGECSLDGLTFSLNPQVEKINLTNWSFTDRPPNLVDIMISYEKVIEVV